MVNLLLETDLDWGCVPYNLLTVDALPPLCSLYCVGYDFSCVC